MPLRGKAHPNSNSAWGHKIDIKSTYVWEDIEWAKPGSMVEDEYKSPGQGEIRFYIIAIRKGKWTCTGPAPDRYVINLLYVDQTATFGIDKLLNAEHEDGEWVLEEDSDGIEPSLKAKPVEDATIPESKQEKYAAILENTHQIPTFPELTPTHE